MGRERKGNPEIVRMAQLEELVCMGVARELGSFCSFDGEGRENERWRMALRGLGEAMWGWGKLRGLAASRTRGTSASRRCHVGAMGSLVDGRTALLAGWEAGVTVWVDDERDDPATDVRICMLPFPPCWPHLGERRDYTMKGGRCQQ